jgi:hypothetical protein
MSFERQDGVVTNHSFAIVSDFEQSAPARFNLDGDSSSAGINTVFDKFLCNRGGTLHNLTGCYLICYVVCEDADFGHVGLDFGFWS